MSAALPPLPKHMALLRTDPKHGTPIPWYVFVVGGVPDYAQADADKLRRAAKHKLCWLCGGPLGSLGVFVFGPLGFVQRISTHPPSHRSCVEYALQVCPYLMAPLQADSQEPANRRNPGVSVIYVAHRWAVHQTPTNILFHLGPPAEARWWSQGREATREECAAGLELALPELRAAAAKQGERAMVEVEKRIAWVASVMPPPKVLEVPT